MEKKTLIQIEYTTWYELNKRKRVPNESFDDVIKRLLLETPEVKQ